MRNSDHTSAVRVVVAGSYIGVMFNDFACKYESLINCAGKKFLELNAAVFALGPRVECVA